MVTQQSKADHSQKPGFTLARAPSNRQLGIQFFPVIAFAVNCRPGDTKPADNHLEGSKRSMNGGCGLAESDGHSTSEVPGNARARA
jgi:hypothetical protein